jgi:hypothetical protein
VRDRHAGFDLGRNFADHRRERTIGLVLRYRQQTAIQGDAGLDEHREFAREVDDVLLADAL